MSENNSLFAIEAEQMLEAGRPEDAIRICVEGLDAFPDYQVAYGIMSKAYLDIGNIELALSTIESAVSEFPNNRSLIQILDQIRDDHPELITFEESEEQSVEIVPELVKVEEVPERKSFLRLINVKENRHLKSEILRASYLKLIPGLDYTPLKYANTVHESVDHVRPLQPFPEFSVVNPKRRGTNRKFKGKYDISGIAPSLMNPEDRELHLINELTARLEKAKMPRIEEIDNINDSYEEEDEPKSSASELITETMAKIYEMQGAKVEAIGAYRKLMIQHPNNSDYYLEKIKQIETN